MQDVISIWVPIALMINAALMLGLEIWDSIREKKEAEKRELEKERAEIRENGRK